MKIIALHSDFIEFEPLSKALNNAEETEKKIERVEDCLVVLSSIEKTDEGTDITTETVKHIIDIANKVKTNKIVIYPWVHLTSQPSNPEYALSTLKKIVNILKEKNYDVTRSAFGWYKMFNIKCKGHPLSELSRTISATNPNDNNDNNKDDKNNQTEESQSLKDEQKAVHEFFILDPNGEMTEIKNFNFQKHQNLRKFAQYEESGERVYAKESPHIKLMKDHAIAGYEPGSDPGNLRWYANGTLIKRLLENKIIDYCVEYGAMEVETPIMYDYNHPTLKKYLDRFPARHYTVMSDDKKLFLRFAACFGMFLMTRDMLISYKSLPLRMIENTRYSFRREQRGELTGLKRLRAFTMPDMHTFCDTIDSTKQEFYNQFHKSMGFLEIAGVNSYEAAFRVQKDFFEENKEWYKQMVKDFGKPVLIELFDIRYAYFVTKFEFNFVDSMNKASALSTVQIDVENADTYDINYIDSNGDKKKPFILHASISGGIDRVIYSILEQEHMKTRQGIKPMFPLWLSPTQVRIIPVNVEYNEHCEQLMNELNNLNIRTDIDDRNESLGKRIRTSEKEWTPYTIVVGEKEISSGKYAINCRKENKKIEMSKQELINEIQQLMKDKPTQRINNNTHLSKRVII